MRSKSVVGWSVLGALVLGLGLGCGEGEIKVAEAPAPTPVPTTKVPKDVKKGGGPSSSGNMGRNPGADPLSK